VGEEVKKTALTSKTECQPEKTNNGQGHKKKKWLNRNRYQKSAAEGGGAELNRLITALKKLTIKTGALGGGDNKETANGGTGKKAKGETIPRPD